MPRLLPPHPIAPTLWAYWATQKMTFRDFLGLTAAGTYSPIRSNMSSGNLGAELTSRGSWEESE